MQTSLSVVIIGASAALSFPGAAEARGFCDRVITVKPSGAYTLKAPYAG